MESSVDRYRELAQWIADNGRFDFSRSGGPGGQNVNKVNTRATLRVPLAELPLTVDELSRLRNRLAKRLTEAGEIVIHASDTRSQLQNRRLAADRLVSLLISALQERPKRRPTEPSQRARIRRLEAKRRRGEVKNMRRPPDY